MIGRELLDYFKELVSAANSRVRSPVLGSIAVVFIALNWKEFFFVFFAEIPVQVRLSYFDVNTDAWSLVYWPLIIGGALSFLYPWITLVSSQFAKFPLRALKTMQSEEENLRQIRALEHEADLEKAKAALEEAKAEYEKETEERVLAAAQRLNNAEEISPSIAEGLKQSRREEIQTEDTVRSAATEVESMSALANTFLVGLARNELGIGALRYSDTERSGDAELDLVFAKSPADTIYLGRHRRTKLIIQNDVQKLLELGLIEATGTKDVMFDEFIITEIGYQVVDNVDMDFKEMQRALSQKSTSLEE